MTKYFKLFWQVPGLQGPKKKGSESVSSCSHTDRCRCSLHLEGVHTSTLGLSYSAKSLDKTSQFAEVAAFVNGSLRLDENKNWIRIVRDPELDYFRLKVKTNSSVQLLPQPPIDTVLNWSFPVHLGSVNPKIDHALKKSDYRYLKKQFPRHSFTWLDLSHYVWSEYPKGVVPPLQWEILRQWSGWRMALGKTNGKPHVLSAMEDLYPRKGADAVLNMCRDPVPPAQKEALQYIPEAMNIMYQKMKVRPDASIPAKLSFQHLANMYLGSSSGINQGPHFKIPVPKGMPVNVSARGKKLDVFESDVLAILEFIRSGEEPPVWWNVSFKNENFFSFVKQMSEESWLAWKEKLRVFIIPSSIFVLVEKMIHTTRMLKERGWVIQIGHKHSRGGADRLARVMKITLENCFNPLLFEGDVDKFDQSVIEYFIDLYINSGITYFDPHSPDYPIFEMLNRWLLKNLLMRITHLFGDIWGVVRGGVPSGIFNTSHLDSWVMALYFFLFCVYTIHTAPLEHREYLEEILMDLVAFMTYGDDHSGNPGDDPIAQVYFGGYAFAAFMKKHFGVVIRDLKCGVSFCSTTVGGWLTRTGLTFLKHQFVLNPLRGQDGQCNFLPFRESKEYMVRVIYGRETRERDELDVMMSCVGHAYGTYASNRDAYDRLALFFEELLWVTDVTPGHAMSEIVKRISVHDMKKLRQLGISSDELLSGFPTWETIAKKNVMDWVYQDITNVSMRDISPWDDVEWENCLA